MEDNGEYAMSVDISTEVTITDPRPRFTGTYSDVYIGQFRNQTVHQQNADVHEHEADASL